MRNIYTYLLGRGFLGFNAIIWRTMIALLFCISYTGTGYGKAGNSFNPAGIEFNPADTISEYNDDDDNYEEISITLNVQRIGSLEIPAIIYGPKVYLSIKDLFDFLKLRNVTSAQFDSLSGFFINPKAPYLIDKTNNKIVYQDKIFRLKATDLINKGNVLYLKSDYFGQVFGLNCDFDFRSLTVTLNTKIELPAIREMQLELMRQNLSQLKAEKKADTIIRRSFPLFHIGMADWSVMSTQKTKARSNTRASLGIGGIVAGGEMNLLLNYNSDEKLNLRQQYYQWRFVDNDHKALRQVIAGKIFAQSVSSIYGPVIGVQFTNTPTTYRRSFGTYTLSNTTEPEWMVELYVNNVLVNYTKADASGFYTFEVPMVYGNSVVKLRFYGPWGEERTSEKYISIPFNFIPLHEFEYNLTAGVVDDDKKSKYSRANFNYGLSRRITIGGGMEYLSSLLQGKYMPFINASLRLSPRMLVSAEHTYGVRSKAIFSYRLPSNLQVDFNYTRYDKDQTAVRFNYLEEKKMVVSMPLKGKRFTAFSRFTLNQFTLPGNELAIPKIKNKKFTAAEFLLSTVVSGISSNLTTYAVLSNSGNPLVYSNLSMTFRLPGGIRLTPQAQYEFREKNFSMIKAEVEKNIFNRGFLNIAYEKALVNKNIGLMTIGVRYNFSFAQTYFSASKSAHTIATTQSARGSLLYDNKTNYLGVNNQTSVGKGGIIVSPYLDLNCNGKRDAGEPKAFGLNLRINGGSTERNNHDTTLRITGLEAYTNYLIELDKTSFDNIAWQIRKQTMRVTIEPNNFKLIEVAVAVVGEVSGTVYLKNIKGKNGLGRIIVNFYNSDNVLVGKTLTEDDGYFSFIEFAPGHYTARVDLVQLQKLKMISSPSISFNILSNKDGDVKDGLQFILQPAN
ncbi:MAG: hypothetical protein ABI741_15470 [Ferruginibacter sp.]